MRKKTLKITALILGLILAISLALAGCGRNPIEPETSAAPETTTTQATTEETSTETKETATETTPEETTTEETTPEETTTEETTTEKQTSKETKETTKKQTSQDLIDEDEAYYDVESVVLYLDKFGHLPDNFITKDEAEDLGWSGGSVDKYQKGAAIGGDYFGNYEGILPKNTKYHEADIDTYKAKRGSKRLIYSKDGRYYYTEDHYESFDELGVKKGEIVWY